MEDHGDEIEKARCEAVSNGHSGHFLEAVSKESNRLNSMQFRIAVASRLGMDLPFVSSALCCDCKARTLIDRKGYHMNCCGKGGEWTRRHDTIVFELKALAASAGCATEFNPKNCFPINKAMNLKDESGKAPDLLIRKPGKLQFVQVDSNCPRNIIVDVRVNYALSKSNICNPDASFKGKNSKYKSLSEASNLFFLPFIIDKFVYGKNGSHD